MKPKIVIFARLVLIASVFIVLSSCLFQKATPIPANNSPSIAALDIPEEAVTYPDDWPEQFRLPSAFTLVETNSGTSVGGSSQSWTAMYRMNDSVDEAERTLQEHFADLGWIIPVSEKRDTGSFVFLLEKEESNGFIVIEADADKKNQLLIMATFSQ